MSKLAMLASVKLAITCLSAITKPLQTDTNVLILKISVWDCGAYNISD